MSYLVPMHVAALALNITPEQLDEWAVAGIVTPTTAAPGAAALWDVEQLREQVHQHLERDGGDGSS